MSEPASEKSIFLHAAGLDAPAARSAYLDAACGPDPSVRARIEGLLAAHDRLGGDPPPTAGADSTAASPGPATGAVLGGRFKLVEVIGEGGMGEVWLAQQTEPVKRLVALKVIKAGMDSKSVLARFEAERQALALMDHPNISKVLDAGATPEGRPFFVMELVKGVPITRFCDERKLSPRERLELFLSVCHAIQHAHQKGVIHRDLKPSNVLVALYDGRPVPKVIDFGVAKAAGQPLTEKTLVTGLGAVVGTPEYMSPEQAELNQLDIDTRSDVYSLGVLLYELLTGTTPLSHRRVKQAALLEVLRLIREEDPPRPSTRLSTTAELPSIAAKRGLEPRKLSGLMRGELDWIVMKALEKDRSRRYETANGLALDVQRYLADEAVLACPPSMSYRVRKFVRRNKGAALVAAALATVLVVAALGATVAAFREKHLKQVAQESADSERVARKELERTLNFERIALVDQKLAADHRDQVDELLDQCPPEMREWEWYYLKHWRHAEPCTEFHGHSSWLTTVAFHPDSRHLASGGEDRAIRIWDRTTGKQARPPLYGHFGTIMKLAFSPDGRYLLSTSGDKTVKVWDAANYKLLHDLRGHDDFIYGMAVSPDSRLVATTGRDRTVRIWEIATKRLLNVCRGLEGYGSSVAFSADGRRIVGLSAEGVVKVWDVATGEEVLSWREPISSVRGDIMAVSPEGQHLAVGSGREIRIRSLADGREVRVLRGHFMQVFGIAYSPDGRRLASAGWDNTAKLWDPESGRELLTLRGHPHVVRGITFSADGRHLATGCYDHTVRVWSATDVAQGTGGLIRTVRTAEDRNQVAIGLNGHPGFHPDGRRMPVKYSDGTIRVWDVGTDREAGFFRVREAPIHDARFSADGSRLAATDTNGFVKVWDVATGQELWGVQGSNVPGPAHLAISPDGRWLAYAREADGGITIRDLSTGAQIKSLGAVGQLASMEFSRDGRLFAACGVNRNVKVFKTDGFQEWRTLKQPDVIIAIRFSPDGRRLATGSADARVWDLETEKELLIFPGHKVRVTDLDFSPDGRAIASAGDTEALIWDAADGRVLRRFRGHAGIVLGARFNPDGKWLVTSGDDATLKVWDATLSPLDWHGPAARKLVDERFAELLLRSDVVESLRADKTIPAEVLPVALQLAEEYDEDPRKLEDASIAVVKERGGDTAAYRLALRRAEAACRLFPDNGGYLNTLGLAYYRVGQYKEAGEALRQGEPSNTLRMKGPWGRDLGLRALLQLQEGRLDEARATVAQLREVIKNFTGTPTVSMPMLRELEGLLGRKNGDGATKTKRDGQEVPQSP